MKWRTAGFSTLENAVNFIRWLKDNGIGKVKDGSIARIGEEPFQVDGVWKVAYMPIGREQIAKCEQRIEYLCDNDLI